MIKAVLIIVTLPGTWQPGKEAHAYFDTMEQCEKAVEAVIIPEEAGGWKFCTNIDNEKWFYESFKPKS